jgi:methionine-rich copper-binding protein CopC
MGTKSDMSAQPVMIEAIEPRLLLSTTLIAEGDLASYRVPTDSSVDAVWRDLAYDDSGWSTGDTGIGYERSSGFEALIATDVESPMYNHNETIYIRMPFDVGWAGGVTEMTLRMKFEDGFAAYVNGEEVTSHNAPDTLIWNSGATDLNSDSAAVVWEDFDVSSGIDALVSGTNVLAIHGLNRSVTSSDFLILPELVAEMDETHFGVDSTNPADGTILGAAPTSVTVEFSEDVQAASVQASDLQISGQSATGFTQLGVTTVRFDLPAGLSSGLHTYTLAEGAMQSTTGKLLAAYTGEFSVVTAPVVNDLPATAVSHSGATLNGQVVQTGGETPDVHIVWGTSDGGTDVGNWSEDIPLGALGAGSFSYDLFALQADTPYYYRVYATNWAGTSWAPETTSFTTDAAQAADVFALPATNILPFGARLNGEVFDTGGDDPEAHIVWGTDDGGTDLLVWQNDVNIGVVGLDAFYTDATELEAETTYYYSVYSINSAGVSWSPISREFTTGGDFPLVTEVMASNNVTIADQDGDYPDWIEIFNPGDAATDLAGWYLTDSSSDLTKWQFPAVTVLAGEHLLVFASNKDRAVAGQELHTSFALSASGEYVALVMPDGETVAHGYDFPEQFADISYGLTAELTEFRYFATPTPGTENSDDYWGYVEPVQISVQHGFYDAPFDVYLSCETPDATIRYTTNGSAPTSDSGTVYTPGTPITITTTTVLRAGGFKADHQDAVVNTESYIFLDDVLTQPNDQSAREMPTQWITSSGTTRTADYELDPDVVNDAAYSGMIEQGLLDLPTLSLGMDNDDLFDRYTGIYANPQGRGFDWERPVSAEFFDSTGTENFSVNAGIRIAGEIARSPTNNAKYPLRLAFRNAYGPGKLEYPLFANTHVERFDTLTLRAHYGSSWISGTSTADYIRNPFLMETFVDTENPAAHGRLTHLYLNGVYWGIYEISERPDDSFNAEYLGGTEDDWDIIKGGISGGVWQGLLEEGSKASYDAMMDMVPASMSQISDAGYQQLKQYLDMENFIDYMIVNIWAQNHDWPQKNWYAASMRDPADPAGAPLQKFRFYTWDMESTLGWHEQNRTLVGDLAGTNMGPGQIYGRIRNHPEFMQLFGDRLQKIFFNDGAMTEAANRARYQAYADQLDRAIILESARWGDWRNPSSPYTRNDHWLDRIGYMVGHDWYGNDWMSMRNDIVLGQFRDIGLFPSVDAPVYSQHGGEVASGYELQVTGTGTIHYTLDGSDPVGSPLTLTSGGRITLSGIQEVTVQSRAYSGGEWSPLNRATFVVGASTDTQSALRISELMYNPGVMEEAPDLEYIELLNTGAEALLVGGSSFVNGVQLTVPSGTIIPAGGRVLLVGFDPQTEPAKVTAFETHYDLAPGSVTLLGPYAGVLSDGGERLGLSDAGGDSILSFEYGDGGAWPGRADGRGASLEVIDPLGDYDDPNNWRSSTEYGGNPGTPGMGPLTDIVINEVLSHTDLPDVDSIELYNTTDGPIDIGGWYLSDSSDEYRKYRIPDETTIGAHEYVVFDEWDFNASLGVNPEDFALNGAHGDDVWLMATNPADRLTRFVDHVEFEASLLGESFGRWPDGTGDLYPMVSQSLGYENSGPRVGPLILSEIMYNSGELEGSDDLEYVEVYNPTGGTVDLTEWRIRKGIDFDFPEGTQILPGQAIVVLSFNPDSPLNASRTAAFRSHYGIDELVPLLGGYSGKLENGGERVQLQRPDSPPLEEPEYVPHTVEDDVRYDEAPPWPGADGDGNSLHRSGADVFGGDASGWIAEVPSPGSSDLVGGETHIIVSVPTGAWENAGLLPGAGTVRLSRSVAYDVEVTLASDDGSELSLPTTTVLIPAGQTAVPIDLLVVDDDDMDGAQTVTITATATVVESILGDANGDGAVTDADYTIWADNYGTQSGATQETGDFNGDGAVTDADYTLWADNYGTVGNLGEEQTAPLDGFAELTIRDDEVSLLEISQISGPQTAGEAFAVQVRAADVNGETVEVYTGPIQLTAHNAQGAVSVTPETLAPLTAGMWIGNVTVQAVASGVVLDVQDDASRSGSSNAFDVVSGPFDHYEWSAIDDPQYVDVPFDVVLTAADANGYPTDLSGPVALTAELPSATAMIGDASALWQFPMRTYYDDSRTQTIYLAEEIGAAGKISALSLEVTTSPGQPMDGWTLRMRHTPLAQYDTPAWESEGWVTVYQANEPIPGTGWIRFELQTPFAYNGVDNLMIDFSHDNGFRTSTGYCRSTDTGVPRSIVYYANSSEGNPLDWSGQTPAVVTSTQAPDLQLEMDPTISISPGEVVFTAGQWSGQVTLGNEAESVSLALGEGSSSNVFSVETAPLTLAPVSAVASSQYSSAVADKTVDGSGLSDPLAPDATHSTDWAQMWLSNAEASPTIRFDLGGEFLLTGMHVWNYNQVAGGTDLTGRGVQSADVWISTTGIGDPDSDPSDWTLLSDDLLLTQATGDAAYEGEDYALGGGELARFVLLTDIVNFDGGDYTGLSEVRFFAEA